MKSSLVGLIIGRAGENLRKVESESGARVQFLQTKDPHATERQCTISGPVRSRDSAKSAIFAIIEENGGANVMQDKGAYTAGMPGRAKVNLPALRDGEDSTQVMVPDKTVGLIIGRGGETIKDLQERSGCHVNILGETKSVNGLRPINLIGSQHAVGVAKDLILEIVESDSRGQQGTGSNAMHQPRERAYDNGRGGHGGQGGQGGSRKTIQVPSQAVGMIIGKGGETIKDLQRNSGCKINVHQPSPPDINRDIDLEGAPHQMEEAERVIWEKVETVQERDGNSGGRGGRGGGGRGGDAYDQGPSYDGYSQQQQQPAMSGYGQYQPQQQQAPPAMPSFQMPALPQQSTPTQGSAGTPAQDPNQAYQQFYAQWYMQQMMAQGQQPGAPPGPQ